MINTIGGYTLHGLHYQRMYGDIKEESCDESYFHIRCIRAFLSVLSGFYGRMVHVYSEEATAEFREGDLDLIRDEACGRNLTSFPRTKWSVLLILDVQGEHGDCWAAVWANLEGHNLIYCSLDSANEVATSRNIDLASNLFLPYD